MTASLIHRNELLEEQLASQTSKFDALQARSDALVEGLRAELRESVRNANGLSEENASLKEKIFDLEKLNTFYSGVPYPMALSQVKIGDPIEKAHEVYSGRDIEETEYSFIVDEAGEIFRTVFFRHSNSDATTGIIDSIKYDLGTIERILNNDMEKIPKEWLETSLIRALGEPFTVGLHEGCLLWRVSDRELVYYLRGADWFEIGGYVTYPAGCSITEEQVKGISAELRAATEEQSD